MGGMCGNYPSLNGCKEMVGNKGNLNVKGRERERRERERKKKKGKEKKENKRKEKRNANRNSSSFLICRQENGRVSELTSQPKRK